jgi:DNA-binding MarR family transcriptional regulator
VATDLPKVSVAVKDRILLHLLEHREHVDRFVVPHAVTRDGIAEACALHPPNVSRAMRTLTRDARVSEHLRSVDGEERRRKTWQLTDTGTRAAEERADALRSTKVLLRGEDGQLLEVPAHEARERLDADIGLLRILMHAQHEGVLTYGDIRFGLIRRTGGSASDALPPGRLTMMAGAHATYHTSPPTTRKVRGRKFERSELNGWFEERRPAMLVHGIAGIGKSTLVANWLEAIQANDEHLSVCWYPCQPWDTVTGLAVSLLHRFGIDDQHDPYDLMSTLPLQPGAQLNIDLWRRRLLAYLTDARTIRDRFDPSRRGPPPYWLVVIDDAHHLTEQGGAFYGALLSLAEKTPVRLLFISRRTMDFYDQRDVHTRDLIRELPLEGLPLDVVEGWLQDLSGDVASPQDVLERTGGHPLALELLELYGDVVHGDWLRFLDQEILASLPEGERDMLATLASAEAPVPWARLAEAVGWEGSPPQHLIEHGLLLDLKEGMWLHEALRERLLREVGGTQDSRRASLEG